MGGMHTRGCACGGGVHLHAGHACARVHVGGHVCGWGHTCAWGCCTPPRVEAPLDAHPPRTRVCTRGHPCSPPQRRVPTLKHGKGCIYINTNIYIYIHTCTRAWVRRTEGAHTPITATVCTHRCAPTIPCAHTAPAPIDPAVPTDVHTQVPPHTWPRTPPV